MTSGNWFRTLMRCPNCKRRSTVFSNGKQAFFCESCRWQENIDQIESNLALAGSEKIYDVPEEPGYHV